MTLQNLSDQFAIVDPKTGRPTTYFMGLIQNRGIAQDDAETRLTAIEGITINTTSPIAGGGASLGDGVDFTLSFIDVAASKLLGRGSAAGAGAPQEITVGTGLSLSGTTLSCTLVGLTDGDKGDITVSASGATWTIDNGAVSLAKQADVATASVFYRKTAGAGAPEVQTLATLKTDLGLTGTNSGDQTTIVGITGTKAQFDTAVTDGNFLYVGDVTQYTDEMARDALGTALVAGTDISVTVNDGADTITIAYTGSGSGGGGSSTGFDGSGNISAVAIKGTTAGTPGTGAFTPNAASSGFRAWSTLFTGWVGLVRFEEGSDWELCFSYWNGTTLSRGGLYASSTGSALSLTSAATATLVNDIDGLFGIGSGMAWLAGVPRPGSATYDVVGFSTPTITNQTGAGMASTNYLTEQPRVQTSSATTANAQCAFTFSQVFAITSSTAGRGGWIFTVEFGPTQLPTGPKFYIGAGVATPSAATEPSNYTNNYAVLGKDSTDANFQFLVNNNSGGGTKIDTGLVPTANAWYKLTLWSDPGSLTVHMLLIRRDNGDIYYGSTASDVPVAGASLVPCFVGGLSATTGTALIIHVGNLATRTGR